MKVLYVGPLWEGTTCLQRMQAMQDLGHEVIPIDTEPEEVRKKQKPVIIYLYIIYINERSLS